MSTKILLICHKFFPDIGGIESTSEILASRFQAAGHDVRVLTWSSDPAVTSFPFAVIRNPSILKLFSLHRWAEVVLEINPCLRLSWPNLLYGRPLIISLQTWFGSSGHFNLIAELKKVWLKRAKRVIACSEAVKDKVWIPSIVIGNPYDDSTFKILPQTTHKKNDFVFLGRLVKDKGADLAISALSLVLKSTAYKTKLTIIGEGNEKEHLLALTARLGLNQRITFKGSLRGQQLVQCLNDHKYLLVPSRWEEPFGIVALEGIACGCIPIVANNGGLSTAIGKAGITFKCNDSHSLSSQMLHLLNNAKLEEDLCMAAPSHLKEFTADEVAFKYLSIIKRVIN